MDDALKRSACAASQPPCPSRPPADLETAGSIGGECSSLPPRPPVSPHCPYPRSDPLPSPHSPTEPALAKCAEEHTPHPFRSTPKQARRGVEFFRKIRFQELPIIEACLTLPTTTSTHLRPQIRRT